MTTLASIRRDFAKFKREQERIASAKATGKVAYWAEDSLGRRRLLTLWPEQKVPRGAWRADPDNEDGA